MSSRGPVIGAVDEIVDGREDDNDVTGEREVIAEARTVASPRKKKRRKGEEMTKTPGVRRKVGRPKNSIPTEKGQRTLMAMFKTG